MTSMRGAEATVSDSRETAALEMPPRTVAWDDIVADEPVSGVRRQIVNGARQTLVRYLYAPGSIFPVHAHPEEQVTVVLRGRIGFDVAGAHLELGPGEIAVIPGGVAHGAAVVGTEEVETINALSPRRHAHPGEASSSGQAGGDCR